MAKISLKKGLGILATGAILTLASCSGVQQESESKALSAAEIENILSRKNQPAEYDSHLIHLLNQKGEEATSKKIEQIKSGNLSNGKLLNFAYYDEPPEVYKAIASVIEKRNLTEGEQLQFAKTFDHAEIHLALVKKDKVSTAVLLHLATFGGYDVSKEIGKIISKRNLNVDEQVAFAKHAGYYAAIAGLIDNKNVSTKALIEIAKGTNVEVSEKIAKVILKRNLTKDEEMEFAKTAKWSPIHYAIAFKENSSKSVLEFYMNVENLGDRYHSNSKEAWDHISKTAAETYKAKLKTQKMPIK